MSNDLLLALVSALGRAHSRATCAATALAVLAKPLGLRGVVLVMPDGRTAKADTRGSPRGEARTLVLPLPGGPANADLTGASVVFVQASAHAEPSPQLTIALATVLAASIRQVHTLARAGEVSRLAHLRGRALDERLREVRPDDVILPAPASRRLFSELIPAVARLDATVLITGETGTGKEIVAQRIHALSPRARRPFVQLNCGAIPPGLVESALFGHERGAFTGADRAQLGAFERAQGGTLLLDEIGDLPLPAQVRLLRVLATRELLRVGGQQTIALDVRVLAATHRDLEAMVEDGAFRRDLLYRLDVLPLHVTPLRDRPLDIDALARGLLLRLARRHGRATPKLDAETRARLRRHAWPGNVRELENVLERSLVLMEDGDDTLHVDLRVPRSGRGTGPTGTFQDQSRRAIEAALRSSEGRVYGPGGAAERLGLKPTTLASKMKRLGLPGPRARAPRP